MKKTYKKPMMIVEWFALSQTIATGCGDLSNYGSPTLTRMANCAWDFNGSFLLFLEGNNNCEYQIVDGTIDVLCYNGPSPSMSLFHS